MPTLSKPEITHRFITRVAGWVSRLVITDWPGLRYEPNAWPSFSANSGVNSRFAKPLMPTEPNSEPGHFCP